MFVVVEVYFSGSHPGGQNVLSIILWLSNVLVPMRMSGSDAEMKLPSSAICS